MANLSRVGFLERDSGPYLVFDNVVVFAVEVLVVDNFALKISHLPFQMVNFALQSLGRIKINNKLLEFALSLFSCFTF